MPTVEIKDSIPIVEIKGKVQKARTVSGIPESFRAGYRIPFRRKPLLIKLASRKKSFETQPTEDLKCEIQKMLSWGAIRLSSHDTGFLSTMSGRYWLGQINFRLERPWSTTIASFLKSINIEKLSPSIEKMARMGIRKRLSRHTSVLLLLASGRRVHDLTLLSIQTDLFQEQNNELIFWPKFDNSTYRQSGWCLKFHSTPRFNLIYWVKQVITLSEKRKFKQIESLFITTRGNLKEASRAVIAGWIKTLFKEARITTTARSIRAGIIRTLTPLDRETQDHYWLTLCAQDHGLVPKHACIEVSRVNRTTGSCTSTRASRIGNL
ncbi:putative reverse transcriptase-7 [Operophtera brumata]|uniref:Putative reverse transcriptase-7 n=1 Tax=Operophtera brumata TaxID=104452 RepID=A0A0L7KXC8_OPEBR|nr:putative reverse transcriptase-7 [Operophtera brumata]